MNRKEKKRKSLLRNGKYKNVAHQTNIDSDRYSEVEKKLYKVLRIELYVIYQREDWFARLPR